MHIIKKSKAEQPNFTQAIRFWFLLGWISFGGTTGHVTIMHDFLVEKKKWVSNAKFFSALNACMILPGPEAHQLAIYLGWKLHGIKGGIISGIFFILPSILIIWSLSILYALYGNTPLLISVFDGLKPAVLAIIIYATWRVSQKSLISFLHYFIAFASFISSYFLHIPTPWIIIGVIFFSIVIRIAAPEFILIKKAKSAIDSHEDMYYVNIDQGANKTSFKTITKQLIVFLILWFVPFLSITFLLVDTLFWQKLSLLFTQSAFLTIGGSYTVIPYVANLVTNKLAWLSKTQMIDGFALAETTPGPLVIVLSYVGFMAGLNHFNGSLLMGTIGLLTASYFTFLPNFIMIFMGAPLIEKSQKNPTIQAVLSLITAAVVGVIVNLAFYLGESILFSGKVISSLSFNPMALGWVLFSLVLLIKYKVNMISLILISLGYGAMRYILMF
ncbi:chromate transporter [Flavobacterium aquidurense]|uniref:chromate efflux transporter n=1 Tax=Flavobacterium aquidurense TaxID=362413 RepID=UPI000911717D|nr:chromate efflux transporter [Flavobacterium aquidurense]OXA69785.1 chromate transporter [Flavobacterium aquidurense]SHH25901.1 chromate transporter [Flavobacterium frigidimaris]